MREVRKRYKGITTSYHKIPNVAPTRNIAVCNSFLIVRTSTAKKKALTKMSRFTIISKSVVAASANSAVSEGPIFLVQSTFVIGG